MGRQSSGPAWRVITWNGIVGAWRTRARPGGAYAVWDDQHRRGIYTRQFSWQVRDADPFGRLLALHASHPSDDPLERALYVDLRTSLADNVLACADRAAGAAGMSLRFPFLDRDLVVLAATTPSAVKQRGAHRHPCAEASAAAAACRGR